MSRYSRYLYRYPIGDYMDINKLKGIIPEKVLSELPMVMSTFEINTPLRLAHFLSQCAHESWNFTAVRENLNYGPVALMSTFKKYFPNLEKTDSYARQPEKIANLVYANRMGNGPETSGDGWKYRGRGYIQLTGKINYQAFDKVVEENILEQPDLVAVKYPLLSAAWFWNSRRLNGVADRGSSELVVTSVTKLINGGTNGLLDRIAKFNKYFEVLK
jgi:putative chitinase